MFSDQVLAALLLYLSIPRFDSSFDIIFKVHLFVGSSWSSGPSVDYMFFRNNTPNESKLSAQLVKSPDQCAYCCQCSWTNTATERILVQGASGDPQWTCAGH